MSIAGTWSFQGDEYQLRVALYWMIRLLKDDAIEYIQVESLGAPGDASVPTVDDVIVAKKDGTRIYIQAKKNQTKNRSWSFTDEDLKKELKNACQQLERDPQGIVYFYSRTPFGELSSLIEGRVKYPSYSVFANNAPETLKRALASLSQITGYPLAASFDLCQRIKIGPLHNFSGWDESNLESLAILFARPNDVKDILERMIARSEAGLANDDSSDLITGDQENLPKEQDSIIMFRKDEVIRKLEARGHPIALLRRESDILSSFKDASRRGRAWIRHIDGKPIKRKELAALVDAIEGNKQRILVVDGPGTGKTCLLLDLVDTIESRDDLACLFIKGEKFASARTERDLTNDGLPGDIVGQCARLSVRRRVIVVIDSLDVLSLHNNNSALSLFLDLMDRLAVLENVVVVAACREFDLQYDQNLRARSWDAKVHLEKLDFDYVVRPFLVSWGVYVDDLQSEMKDILCVPHYLRLFSSVAKPGISISLGSAYQLYERFFNDVIVQNRELGQVGLDTASSIAKLMHDERRYQMLWSAFSGDLQILRGLISQNVLIEVEAGVLAFSHQEMADCLVVRIALQQQQQLKDFIKSRPALPYLRPIVRTFFFYLREFDKKAFRSQVLGVLNDEMIAYHLHRLIAESLAEIVPEDEDWTLIRRILIDHTEIFKRLLNRTRSIAWLSIFTDKVLPVALSIPKLRPIVPYVLAHLKVWAGLRSEFVLNIWAVAIKEAWIDPAEAIGSIVGGLEEIMVDKPQECREVLELLVEGTHGPKFLLGHVLQEWVNLSNSGDDLLWKFLLLASDSEPLISQQLLESISLSHKGIKSEFLKSRIAQSDWSLTAALELLLSTYSEDNDRWSMLIHDTSWGRNHDRGMQSYEFTNVMLEGIEMGLKAQSARNTQWWFKHELRIRSHPNLGIRYILVQAYLVNLIANVEGVAFQLTDPVLMGSFELSYELGELANTAYPFLPDETKLEHQSAILDFAYNDINELEQRSRARWVYEQLIWIPRQYRTQSSCEFLNYWELDFGPARPQPRIWMNGGFIGSPISTDLLLKLSFEDILKLIYFTERYASSEGWYDEGGGWSMSQFASAVDSACSLDPARFLPVFDHLVGERDHSPYLNAIVNGISKHLRYRFGSLSPDKVWTPVEPILDGRPLASWLLRMLELYDSLWMEPYTKREAAEACCAVLIDEESAARLTFILLRLQRHEDPINESDNHLQSVSLNTVRGVAARSAMRLSNRLIEAALPLPELLPELLVRFAEDPIAGVRFSVVNEVAYLIAKKTELGWLLFNLAMQDATPKLWAGAERVLYYNYRHDFDRVCVLLERIRIEALSVAGETYGRIAMLSVLAGYMTLDDVFNVLESGGETVATGVVQVLVENIRSTEHTAVCEKGLMRLLAMPSLQEKILRQLNLKHNDVQQFVSVELMAALVQVESQDIWHQSNQAVTWMFETAKIDPLEALPIAESLAELAEQFGSSAAWSIDEEKLVSVLNALLREADESDDTILIQRAIDLQDRFLRLGVSRIDEMLDKASRP